MDKKKGIFAASFIGVASVWLGGHFGPGFATGAFKRLQRVFAAVRFTRREDPAGGGNRVSAAFSALFAQA